MTTRTGFVAFLLVAAEAAFAWLPPSGTNGSVCVSVDGLAPVTGEYGKGAVREFDTADPVSFAVAVSNRSNRVVTGRLKVGLNDDWIVEGAETRHLTLCPREAASIRCSARARESVLPALYPVHAVFSGDGCSDPAHAVGVFRAVTPAPGPMAPRAAVRKLPCGGSVVPLSAFGAPRTSFVIGGKETDGKDGNTGGYFFFDPVGRMGAHPPWRKGPGTARADFDLRLPEVKPVKLAFGVTMRVSTEGEPDTDGVAVGVEVREKNGGWHRVMERLVTEPGREACCEAELSGWAGKEVTLRLTAGPGPANNTSCDGHSWGSPVLISGKSAGVPDENEWRSLEGKALAAAKSALKRGTDPRQGRFLLKDGDFRFGAGLVAGRNGIFDGVIAMSDGREAMFVRGFETSVEGCGIGLGAAAMPVKRTDVSVREGRLVLDHLAGEPGSADGTVRAELFPDGGTLKLRWSLPDARRGRAGTPRFSMLRPGRMTMPAERVYAGFGNVVVRPKAMRLRYGGFTLSTRHAGADFTNGLSLVMATDVVPDFLNVVQADDLFALEAHGDATFVFAPGSDGAFAAARRFSRVSGYRRSPGWERLAGRMCIDQWTGSFTRTAEVLESLAAAGVTNCVYVRHGWQHWGYDTRLPDIWPPFPEWGGEAGFRKMAASARKAGMIFCPHDNYVDRYVDAPSGFSYSDIVFNADGTPQKAFFNGRIFAQSYRWNPLRIMPYVSANMRRLAENDAADAIFLDVFAALYFDDFYDRRGAFHTRLEVSRAWCEALERCRAEAGRADFPTISEAGHDHLIGHLDGAQSDHFSASRWQKRSLYEDSERVPWHDIVSHGKMVLFGGGLADRYVLDPEIPRAERPKHHYGSDDYMGVTVIGGRNAMTACSDSSATRETWRLLGGVTAALAKREMLSFEFVDGDIRRQHSVFSDGGEVWVNRHKDRVWEVAGEVLPPYGFVVVTPEATARVVRRNGKTVRLSEKAKGGN